MKKLLCLFLVVFILLVVGCVDVEDENCYRKSGIKELECEYNEYNSIKKEGANDIIEIVNGLIPYVNECYNQNLTIVTYFTIP